MTPSFAVEPRPSCVSTPAFFSAFRQSPSPSFNEAEKGREGSQSQPLCGTPPLSFNDGTQSRSFDGGYVSFETDVLRGNSGPGPGSQVQRQQSPVTPAETQSRSRQQLREAPPTTTTATVTMQQQRTVRFDSPAGVLHRPRPQHEEDVLVEGWTRASEYLYEEAHTAHYGRGGAPRQQQSQEARVQHEHEPERGRLSPSRAIQAPQPRRAPPPPQSPPTQTATQTRKRVAETDADTLAREQEQDTKTRKLVSELSRRATKARASTVHICAVPDRTFYSITDDAAETPGTVAVPSGTFTHNVLAFRWVGEGMLPSSHASIHHHRLSPPSTCVMMLPAA